MSKPKVAFIGTGGTLASLGAGPLDLYDYGATGKTMNAEETIRRWPETTQVAEVIPVPSPAIGFGDWQALAALCDRLADEHRDLARIVIGHGTATLEETAYALNLTLKVSLPVILVGSQRPSSALGIVSAGFAPGYAPPGDIAAMKEADTKGMIVMQCTRAGSGRTLPNHSAAKSRISDR